MINPKLSEVYDENSLWFLREIEEEIGPEIASICYISRHGSSVIGRGVKMPLYIYFASTRSDIKSLSAVMKLRDTYPLINIDVCSTIPPKFISLCEEGGNYDVESGNN